jgi:hypothetical protein
VKTVEEKRLTNLRSVTRWQARNREKVRRSQRVRDAQQKALGYPVKKAWLRKRDSVARLYWSAKTSAKSRDCDFSLTHEDIVIPERCPVLGIPLFFSSTRTPNTPSIDRIHNHKGYTPKNIVVISWRANKMKGDMSLKEMRLLANFYLGE